MFYKETNFKETSIGRIPRDWKVVKLERIFSFKNGQRPKLLEAGKIPVYGANGIMGYTNEFLVDNDFTIVVGRVGASGEVHLGQGEIWVSDNAIYSESYERSMVYPPFVYYLLKFKGLSRFASKTTHPIITQTFLNIFQIQLPSTLEQQKIAEILSTVDEAIQKTNEIIGKTARLKKGLMQELLTKGIGHKEFKDTEIGRIPKEWRVAKLGEIGTFQYGITASAKEEDTGVKFLRITDIRDNGTINWSEVPFCEISISELSKYTLKVGDVLFARIGATTGKTCYINREIRGVFGSYLIRFLPDVNSQIDTKFLHLFTQSEMYWLQVNRMKVGQLKKGLNTQLLKEIKILLPPLEEQRKIIQVLSTVDKKLEIERNEKAKLERIKQGLMDFILTGKIRVKVNRCASRSRL